jgi:hypothetical protein
MSFLVSLVFPSLTCSSDGGAGRSYPSQFIYLGENAKGQDKRNPARTPRQEGGTATRLALHNSNKSSTWTSRHPDVGMDARHFCSWLFLAWLFSLLCRAKAKPRLVAPEDVFK